MSSHKKNGVWEKKYSFVQNLLYIIKKHWNFDKKYVFLPIIRVPVNIFSSLIILFIPKVILDAVTTTKDVYDMLFYVSILSILLMILNLFNTLLSSGISIGANKFFLLHNFWELAKKKMNINYELFSSYYGKIASKKALSAIEGNIEVGITSFYLRLIELITNIGGFASFVLIISTLNPMIVLYLILSYIIDGILAMYVERFIHKTKNEREKIERKSNYLTYRTSTSFFAKDIRIYTLSSLLNDIKKTLIREGIYWQKDVHRKRLFQTIFEALLMFCRDGATYAYLIFLLLDKESLSIGSFSVYFAAISGFGNWLSQIVTGISAIVSANNAVSDYRNFLEADDEINIDNKIGMVINDAPEIKLVNVSYGYDKDNLILENISLTIKKGEKIAIVGENGSGKTTLIKLICGLLKPKSGEIFVNDIDISTVRNKDYYALISAVFQDVTVLPASIKENITFSKEVDNIKLQQVLEQSDLSEIVSSLDNGIETKLVKQFDTNGIELSGGEMQKLVLARALYKDAPILILDEPTASLDPITERNLYLKYNELVQDKTSIFISHRLSSTKFCDRIILLECGKIVESGTHQELINSNGKYRSMYEVSSKYYSSYEKGYI